MIDDFGHSSGPTFTKSEVEPPVDDPPFGLWCDILDLWLPAEAAVTGTRATERPSSRAPLPTHAACRLIWRAPSLSDVRSKHVSKCGLAPHRRFVCGLSLLG